MDVIAQDLRFALRLLGRQPRFVIGACLTLALAISASTLVFGIADSLLLRPVAGVAEPQRLVALFTSDFSGPPFGASSYADASDLRNETSVFSGVLAYANGRVGIGEGAALRSVAAEAVSANYFEVLGVHAARGRLFNAAEEANPGDVVVVSDGFWRNALGGTYATGGTIRVNGRSFTIVGVTTEGFTGFERTAPVDIWLPVRAAERIDFGISSLDERTNRGFGVVARLARGVSLAQAQAAMQVMTQRFRAAYGEAWVDVRGETRRLTVLPESRVRVPPDARSPLLGVLGVMGGAIAVILLIGCANIAGLLLTRAAARAREMGIRASLGAGRGRLVRQLMTESLLVAAGGAAIGTLLALWVAALISGSAGVAARLGFAVTADISVQAVAVACATAAVAAILFGLVPALQSSRADLLTALKGEARPFTTSRRMTLRDALVTGQIAMSLVLLISALLFVRAVRSAYAIDLGYRTRGMLLVPLTRIPGADGPPSAMTASALIERVRAIPDVRSVSWGSAMPLAGYGSRRRLAPVGYERAAGEDLEFHIDAVGPGFFQSFGIDIVRGRPLGAEDREGARLTAVVNESYASRFWPGADPIGRIIASRGQELTLVGVARNVRFLSLTESPLPRVYVSALQEPRGILLHVRTSDEPMGVLPAIAEVVASEAPGWVVSSPTTLEDQVRTAVFEQRVTGGTIGAFALVALLLAAIGVYGVVALAIAQRTREVGVRMALGATPAEIRRLFARRALTLVSSGCVLGLAGAWAATRILGGMLLDISPRDPLAYGLALCALTLVAFIASAIPARQAARLDPLIAIRSD